MSEEGITEEVVSPFLKQLANARRLTVRFKEDGTATEMHLLFDKIEGNVQELMDVFKRMQKLEKDVIGEFGLIARHVDDILEDGCMVPTIRFKLQTIDYELSKLRDNTAPPLQLPSIDSEASSSSTFPPLKSDIHQPSHEWGHLEMEKKILGSSAMPNLQVSYDSLALQLKLCLLCFSIFPEDSVIKKRPLVYWWIGEGLVTPTRDRTAEEIGEGCFHELIAKGLIVPIRRRHSPVVNHCKLHPWMRRMLISVAKRGQFFDFDSEGNPTSDFYLTRRACLVANDEGTLQQNLMKGRPNLAELLTLFNVNERVVKIDKSWFSDMRKVVVLQLGRWQNSAKHHIEVENTEFLEGLKSFKHLKFLSFQGISRITELPSYIGHLTNLRILDLRACHNLERLTVGITSLRKLTHLDVSECYLLEHMPKGMGSLSELQVMKGFVIADARSRDPCRLSELAKLEKLRTLSINIGSKAVVTEEELNELGKLEALRSLTVTWAVAVMPSRKVTARLTRAATMTIASLVLPPNLEKLDLRCFPRRMMPNWLSPSRLRKLKKLYVRGGMLSNLRPERPAQTWNVEVLRLKFLSDLEMDWAELKDGFPQLSYLEAFKCSKLRSFPCDEDGVWVNNERGV